MPSRLVIQAVVAIVAATYLVAFAIEGAPMGDFFPPLGAAGAAAALLMLAFDRYLWRAPLIHRFVRRPDIRGTWRGSLASEWVDPRTGERIAPDPEVYLAVRQTYWSVSACLLTRESKSLPLLGTIEQHGDGHPRLVAIYRNLPRAAVRDRSPIHHGALLLDIAGDPPTRLEGFYWTDRRTMGEIVLDRRSLSSVNDYALAQELMEFKRIVAETT